MLKIMSLLSLVVFGLSLAPTDADASGRSRASRGSSPSRADLLSSYSDDEDSSEEDEVTPKKRAASPSRGRTATRATAAERSSSRSSSREASPSRGRTASPARSTRSTSPSHTAEHSRRGSGETAKAVGDTIGGLASLGAGILQDRHANARNDKREASRERQAELRRAAEEKRRDQEREDRIREEQARREEDQKRRDQEREDRKAELEAQKAAKEKKKEAEKQRLEQEKATNDPAAKRAAQKAAEAEACQTVVEDMDTSSLGEVEGAKDVLALMKDAGCRSPLGKKPVEEAVCEAFKSGDTGGKLAANAPGAMKCAAAYKKETGENVILSGTGFNKVYYTEAAAEEEGIASKKEEATAPKKGKSKPDPKAKAKPVVEEEEDDVGEEEEEVAEEEAPAPAPKSKKKPAPKVAPAAPAASGGCTQRNAFGDCIN